MRKRVASLLVATGLVVALGNPAGAASQVRPRRVVGVWTAQVNFGEGYSPWVFQLKRNGTGSSLPSGGDHIIWSTNIRTFSMVDVEDPVLTVTVVGPVDNAGIASANKPGKATMQVEGAQPINGSWYAVKTS